MLLFQLSACILGFDHLKSLYANDKECRELYATYLLHPKDDFLIQDGHLFKSNKLCIPKHGT